MVVFYPFPLRKIKSLCRSVSQRAQSLPPAQQNIWVFNSHTENNIEKQRHRVVLDNGKCFIKFDRNMTGYCPNNEQVKDPSAKGCIAKGYQLEKI